MDPIIIESDNEDDDVIIIDSDDSELIDIEDNICDNVENSSDVIFIKEERPETSILREINSNLPRLVDNNNNINDEDKDVEFICSTKPISKVKSISEDVVLLDNSLPSVQNTNPLQAGSTLLDSSNYHSLNDFPVCDPRLELLDPTPDITKLYLHFDQLFFNSFLRTKSIVVVWNKRLRSCSGIYSRSILPPAKISLSSPILQRRPRSDTVNTLIHEMIHAYIDFKHIRDTSPHGKEFRKMMNHINSTAGTNITIYHDFHAEVLALRNKTNPKVNKK